jgi:hypothetical protein
VVRLRSVAAHFSALALFGVLAALFTWPLPQLRTVAVLGRGAGDNLAVIWNFWWVRTALASADHSLFWTPDLFAPIGTSLVTHTLTPLVTVTAALLPGKIEPVALYNAALIAAVFLNFAIAYAAAFSITRNPLSSIFAAVAFGGAPFILVRLYGHLNLLSAWGLPLLLLATLRYERNPSVATALALAGAIGLVAYTDYYYLIFGLLLVALHLLLSYRLIRLQARPLTPRRRGALGICVALISIACVIVVWIYTTGGVDTTVAGIRLRMTDTFNPRVALGFLLAGTFLIWKLPVITFAAPPDPLDAKVWRFLPVATIATALLLSPVLVLGLRLWLAGDYATQTYFWRSAPPGIDVATLFLGNPLGFTPGPWTAAFLERLEIDRMEGTAWLGLAPMALLVVAIRRLRTQPDARVYLWIAGVFFIWSLGPYLRVFGANTAFMLPQTILRFVPGMANARIPGRAIVVVQLMIAVLGAMALASLRQSPRGAAIGVVAVIAVTLECWPRPHPFLPLERSALYASMKAMPPGIVLEIPLGIADGITARGAVDYRVLYNQTLHEHPQMGGAISRMSPRTRAAFDADPIVGPILDLSEGRAPSHDTGLEPSCRSSLACGVRYIVVTESAASDALKAFVTASFSLQPLAHEDGRTLYLVENIRSCECGGGPRP